MVSTSASHVVIFIAALAVAGGVASMSIDTSGALAESLDGQTDREVTRIDSQITIVSDVNSGAIYNNETEEVTLLVKNVGERTLSSYARAVTVTVDGTFVPTDSQSITVIGGGDWTPGEVARISVQRALTADRHRIQVTVNSAETHLEFTPK
ncbi:MAG: hypothetical protein U5K28_06825 [Halobacteriales archaeon]|nr:hypothetical protein [Halobacteriales archaeon]